MKEYLVKKDTLNLKESTISKIEINGRLFFVKRDDLVDPFLSGNKFRKLHTLLNTPKENYNTIISYGGTQSNAMLAIASMCSKKDWNFIYYTKKLSLSQRNSLEGNLVYALSLGMKHIELEQEEYKEYINSLRFNLDSKTYIVDQGGADLSAKSGLEVLAKEIRGSNLDVHSLATPSGTGTTALFLALALPEYKVYTTPCVGDSEYLKEQMMALHAIPRNLVILEPKKKYHFAKVYPEFFATYKKLLSSGIEFDMLYSPSMWESILEQTDEDILYIHSGGVSGNESMLSRYRKKGLTL